MDIDIIHGNPPHFASDESLVVCQELRLGPSTTTELAATVVDAIDNFCDAERRHS